MKPNGPITLRQTDLVHLPCRYERQQVQMLFFDLSRKMYGGYQSLAFNQGHTDMFTLYGSGGSSRFQLLPDRFRIIEQNSGVSLEDFKGKFEVVMTSAVRVFSVSAFALQHVKLRMVTEPVLWDNAVRFLAEKICGFDEDDLTTFEREPSAFAMSFGFLATPEENNTFNVKVEAYEQPQKSVLMDVEGNFGDGVVADDLAQGAANIQRTYEFASQKTMAFLNRFDAAAEGSEGGTN